MGKYQNVKGTLDYFQEDAESFVIFNEKFNHMCFTHMFEPINVPILESTELFQRTSGDSSDIVRKQMYTFKDKSDRNICLRPEFTASVIRAVIQAKKFESQIFPMRYFYSGDVFRYERAKPGTYREFHQIGVESFSPNSTCLIIECMKLCNDFLKTIYPPTTEFVFKINSLGDEESKEEYKKVLKEFFANKIDKMCPDCQERYQINPLRILDCKVPEDKEIMKNFPKMRDYLSKESKEKFNTLQAILKDLKINFEIDDQLVRGLDYYSETVFEIFIANKNIPPIAIGGGGVYKNIIAELGGPSNVYGAGFSFGLERLIEGFKKINDLTTKENLKEKIPLDCYIVNDGTQTSILESLKLYEKIIGARFITDYNSLQRSFKSQFKYAVKSKARYCLILGEEEIKNRTISVKDMITQYQVSFSKNLIKDFLVDSLKNQILRSEDFYKSLPFNQGKLNEDLYDEKNLFYSHKEFKESGIFSEYLKFKNFKRNFNGTEEQAIKAYLESKDNTKLN